MTRNAVKLGVLRAKARMSLSSTDAHLSKHTSLKFGKRSGHFLGSMVSIAREDSPRRSPPPYKPEIRTCLSFVQDRSRCTSIWAGTPTSGHMSNTCRFGQKFATSTKHPPVMAGARNTFSTTKMWRRGDRLAILHTYESSTPPLRDFGCNCDLLRFGIGLGFRV